MGGVVNLPSRVTKVAFMVFIDIAAYTKQQCVQIMKLIYENMAFRDNYS